MMIRKLLCGLVLTMAFELLGAVDTSTTVGTNGDLYCVIDLSEGYAATNYPVSFLSEVPKGGWTDEYKTTKLVLRRIPAGEFMLQNVTNTILTKSYYIGVFEVTQKQWKLVIGDWAWNFLHFVGYEGDTRPADACSYKTIRGSKSGLSWPYSDEVDSNSFIYRIRQKTGLRFDLPTEAQWEYAARANSTNGIYFMQQNDENWVIGGAVYKWGKVHPYTEHAAVGSLYPNNWGLYDMCGNVWEWCLDAAEYNTAGCYASDSDGNRYVVREPDIRDVQIFGGTDPRGAETDMFNRESRMMRGGGWTSSWLGCYSGSRRVSTYYANQGNDFDCGFRLVVGSDHRITVLASVTGHGRVTGCGEYDYGDVATLTATPDPGYEFAGWSGIGMVASTNTMISVLVNGEKKLHAEFQKVTPKLTANGMIGRVSLSWTKVPWAEKYLLYRSTTNIKPESALLELSSKADTYDDVLLTSGKWYYYWIEAKSSDESSISQCAKGYCNQLSIVQLMIRGGDSIMAGNTQKYECLLLRNDSSLEKVDGTWTISEGSDYATVSADGSVTGLALEDGSRTITLLARCVKDAAEWTATKTVKVISVGSQFGFELIEGGVCVTSIPETEAVRIPSEINGLPVRTIGKLPLNYSVKRVALPESVTNIADWAFFRCGQLECVEFSANLVSIGSYAFYYSQMREIILPDSVMEVGERAFDTCSKLGSVRLPKYLMKLSDGVFSGCRSLTNIVWGSRIESIGGSAFSYCTNLVEVTIPHTVTNIGGAAFYGCSRLKKLTLPIGLNDMPSVLIMDCTSLTSLIFEGNLPNRFAYNFYESYYTPVQVVGFAYKGNSSWSEYGSAERMGLLVDDHYPVYFEMNNAVDDSETIKVDAGSKITSFPNPQNRDLTLMGWYTKRVGGTKWTDDMTVECPTKLFARWGYPIVYSGLCGTSNVNPTHYNTGDVVTFSAPDKREGCTFAGWSPSCLTGTETGAVLVAANWQPNQYTIRFHANGGAWSMPDQVCEYGQTYSLIKNAFAKEYYDFAGWATTETGDVVYGDMQSIANLSTKNGAIIDLYAVWALKYVPSPTLEAPENLSFTGKTTKVTLDIGLSGAAVYYSTNGVAPQVDKAYLYNGPFAIDRTTTIMVIAVLDGTQSSCASFVVSKQITSLDDLGDSPSAEDVAEAVADASDPQIVTKIDETNYNDFRDWASRVKTKGGSDAGLQGVMSVDNAWLSYALGQDTLLESAPTDKDLSIETFAPAVEAGKFDFTVSIDKVPVGDDANPSNLAKVLGIEGGTTLESGGLSSENVNISFGTPEGGKVKLTAGPKDVNAKAFFMKVKLNP